ncbi:hypothetical protein [Streptomyces nitrosporeus]|uniref:hypothetical protein n=1 Tax=Streptomyces nitrosporeus TaxID=28894 RepID=UPI00167D3481|nr:hypothetical protein [Streptomyces nitrosporeus]GGZ27979.1 hypothetical protein GCM10010327_68060 [Streptomyces nitrosporeus]
MRRIRITSVTSVSDGAGRRYTHDQTPEVDDDLAVAWIAAGHAEPYTAKRSTRGGRQQATRPAPRNTAKKAAGATSSEDQENPSDDED